MYIGRLAPSPTGLLHLGHARTFWIAFERARAAKGMLWLRDEDLDPQRSQPEFSLAMKEDLEWLGITWQHELCQSDRLPAYRQAMQQLLRAGLIYPCTCSRRDLHQATRAPHEETDDEPIYLGTCRPPSSQLTSADTDMLSQHNYRFRVPDGEVIDFNDGHAGPQAFTSGCDSTANFGDFLVWRKDGLPSYQLACVVDDAFMGITEVVRGRDLLKSTARQILLQRALSLPTPAYYHCDLMRDAGGARLAKRHDALSLRALRESGLSPADVRAKF
ncbi:MAG TPA: tRNA glutamyl-Q(34) synthetase GluQRS [Acidobacteriaceae bacterium]|jgi:glutamyl-tRNA synthetase